MAAGLFQAYTDMNTVTICPQCETLCNVDIIEAELDQATCSNCQSLLPMNGAVSELNDHTARLLIQKAGLPVIIDFYASWCAPCKTYTPLFQKYASLYYEKYIFGKISSEFNPVLAQSLNIKGIPHSVMFDQGQEIKRQVGILYDDDFLEFLDS